MEYMTADPGVVQLNDRLLNQLPDDQDTGAPVYRWAIIYENQRGFVHPAYMTLLSEH